MTLADLLASLFGPSHGIPADDAVVAGRATLPDGTGVHVMGFTGGGELGVDQAIVLAGRLLALESDGAPILFLVDSSSQHMAKRDELMGLNEFLAHLAKAVLLAEQAGHPTIGLLYGGSAAGAFIATALACRTLVALPEAHPAVMDLPSMARVTKLSLDVLKEKAEATPVFAPGVDNLVQVGAIAQLLDPGVPLGAQIVALLTHPAHGDPRSEWGKARGGRPAAADIAARVAALAADHG